MVGAWKRLRNGVILGDLVAVFFAYTVAAKIRYGSTGILWSGDVLPAFPLLALAIAVIIFALAWHLGLYRSTALFGGHRVYPMILTVATYGVISLIMLSYFVGGPPLVSRLWLVSSWLLAVVGISINRLAWRQVALRWRARGDLRRRVLIAGANRHGLAVAQQLKSPAVPEVDVLGFLDDYQRPGTEIAPGLQIVGHPAAVLEVAAAMKADEVIIIAGALAWESQRNMAELVTRPESPLVAHISPTYYDLLTTSADLSHVAYVPVLTLHRSRLSGMNALVKATMDRSIAVIGLLALTPALLWWWTRARLQGRPLLVRDRAFGFGGQVIDVYGIDPSLHVSPVFGRLPALLNVLRGELSLVGPRPIRGGEEDSFERWLSNLLTMRPGLTGLWRFRAHNLPMDERVALDLYYIRNYTFALDLQIMLQSARQLTRRFVGARDELTRWTSYTSAEMRPEVARAPVVLPPSVRLPDPVRRTSGDRSRQDAEAR